MLKLSRLNQVLNSVILLKNMESHQNVALLKLDKFKPCADSLWSIEGDLLCKFLLNKSSSKQLNVLSL